MACGRINMRAAVTHRVTLDQIHHALNWPAAARPARSLCCHSHEPLSRNMCIGWGFHSPPTGDLAERHAFPSAQSEVMTAQLECAPRLMPARLRVLERPRRPERTNVDAQRKEAHARADREIAPVCGSRSRRRHIGQICQDLGISEKTYYRWKGLYGGNDHVRASAPQGARG